MRNAVTSEAPSSAGSVWELCVELYHPNLVTATVVFVFSVCRSLLLYASCTVVSFGLCVIYFSPAAVLPTYHRVMVMKQSCLSFVSKASTEEASPHTSSKRPTEKKKVAPVAKKRKTDSSLTGSLPTALDLYAEFVRSLESHAGEQWATRPLAAVENRALQQKPLSLSEQATPIRMALSSASSVIIRQKKAVSRLNEKIADLQEKLRKARHKAMTSSTASAAAITEASPASTAGSLTADLSPVVIFDSVACVRPWGKFEIRIGTSTLELRSRSASGPQSLVVSLSSITNLIAVKMPTTKEHIVVLPLCDGLQVGKTLQRVLVFKFKTTDPPISSSCVKAGTSRFSADQLRELCQTEAAGGGGSVAAHAMANLLQALTGKNMETTDPAVFRSSAGKDCLTCHYKANHGAVFFFKSGILFALKPIIFIPKDEIRQIVAEFGSQTRYFELIVQTEKHERFGFEMIEIDEHPAVSQFLRDQKFLSTKQEGPDDDSDTEESQQQEQAEPRQDALKKKPNSSSIHDLDEDLDDDSDDADFSPEDEEEEDEGYRTDDDLGDATGSEEDDEDDSAFQAVSGTIDDEDDDDDDEDNDDTRDDKLQVINVEEEEEEQEDTEQMEDDDDNESTD